jgi:hypothetical protein
MWCLDAGEEAKSVDSGLRKNQIRGRRYTSRSRRRSRIRIWSQITRRGQRSRKRGGSEGKVGRAPGVDGKE